jgi:hypothetical protein
MTTGYERRKLELEALTARMVVYGLKESLMACDRVILEVQRRILPRDRAFDLPHMFQRRARLMTELGEAMAKSDALEHRLNPPAGHYDRLRQQEALGIAILGTLG